MKHYQIIGYCQAYYEIARWSNLKTNRSDTYNPTNSATSHWWLWDWAHSMSLRKVSSLYADDNALLCRHWVAKTCTLSISTSLALVVGVSTGLILSLFISTSSWKAKSGSLPSPPADLALDNATNRAPGFLASKPWSPGWTTTYLNASPAPTVIPWHLWIVVPHASRNGTCRRLHRHAQSVERLTGTIGTTVGSSLMYGGPLYPGNLTRTT